MNIRDWARDHVRPLLVAVAITSIGAAMLLAPSSTAGPSGALAQSKGFTGQCAVDASGYCTVTHNAGAKPTAVIVQPALIGQIATVDPNTITATTFRVRFWWYEPALFPAGTIIRFNAIMSMPESLPPTTTPPPTTTTPPATTPPATTPPPTSPPTTPPATSPTAACTNGETIPEGAGRSFFTGSGATQDEYFVHNNNWNDNYGGTHTIVACSQANWYVDVNVPEHSDRAVEAYPNVHTDYNDVPVLDAQGNALIRSARFAHNAQSVAGMTWNASFDIWLGQDFSNELMIWTQNHGQTPAGSKVATVEIGGKTYDVWHETGYTAYVSNPAQTSGTMPLGEFFKDMKTRGWLPTATTWQVDYGVETVDTNAQSWRFNVTDFSIDDDY